MKPHLEIDHENIVSLIQTRDLCPYCNCWGDNSYCYSDEEECPDPFPHILEYILFLEKELKRKKD